MTKQNAAKSAPAKPISKKKPAAKRKAAGKSGRVKDSKPAASTIQLNERQKQFVAEYLIDLNATQAAIRAGYSENTAAEIGYENLRKPQIQRAISEARQKQLERTEIKADVALREAWNIALADARELVQVKTGCCRYCYGKDHRYQRTEFERATALREHLFAHEDNTEGNFDEMGGIGYSPIKLPLMTCPQCGGEGAGRVVLCDTSKISEQAASLYAGAKEGKYGIEVMMHSKDSALERLFKHLGLYEKDNQQKIDPLTSLLHSIAGGNASGFKPIARDPDHEGEG